MGIPLSARTLASEFSTAPPTHTHTPPHAPPTHTHSTRDTQHTLIYECTDMPWSTVTDAWCSTPQTRDTTQTHITEHRHNSTDTLTDTLTAARHNTDSVTDTLTDLTDACNSTDTLRDSHSQTHCSTHWVGPCSTGRETPRPTLRGTGAEPQGRTLHSRVSFTSLHCPLSLVTREDTPIPQLREHWDQLVVWMMHSPPTPLHAEGEKKGTEGHQNTGLHPHSHSLNQLHSGGQRLLLPAMCLYLFCFFHFLPISTSSLPRLLSGL